MTTTEFRVMGMTCSHCEQAVSTQVGQIAGVQDVEVSAATGRLVVISSAPVDEAQVVAAVEEAGYEAVRIPVSTPLRLLGFGAALVAVFALSLVAARTLRPVAAGSAASAGEMSGHIDQEDGMDHTTASTEPSAGSHSGGHSSAPVADPVRGLAVAEDGYQLEALSAPTRMGEDGVLSFRLTGPDGGPVTDYTTSHDKDLHLIVVRSDGSRFRHVHPTTDGAGTWSLPWRWMDAGSYRVFADFVPATTGGPLTLTSTIDVAGAFTPVTPGEDSRTATVDGFAVTLYGTVQAGQEARLSFTVTRDGEPVTTLQPYLGAAGHLVALRAGDLAYLHVHPMGDEPAAASGPDIVVLAQTPTPGRYLLYLDFQVEGQVHTATFTTTVSR